jgi:putative ABC transport system ATP-binding protein
MGLDSRKKEFEIIIRVFAILRGEWRDIGVILTYAFGVGFCSLAIPIAVKSLVNNVAFGTLLQPLVVLTTLLAAVLTLSGLLRVLQLFTVELLQRRFVVRIALHLAQQLPHVAFHKFKKKYGPEYVLRFMEVFSIQKSLTALLLDGVTVALQVILGLILVGFYHPFFLAFALTLLLLLVIFILPLGVGGVRTAVAESDAKYDVMTWLQDLSRYPVIFKSARGDALAIERADEMVNNYLGWRSRHFRVLVRQVLASLLLQILGSSLLLGYGGFLVIKGQLTLGQLVAAELVLGSVLMGISKLGRYLEKFYDLCASVAKLDSLIDIPSEQFNGTYFGVDEVPAHLRVTQLTTHYPSSPVPVLNNCSLDLTAGAKVAVWGTNGSGKSNLAHCIYRLSDPTSGRVEIDGHNVKEIHPLELRSEVALVRGVELFHGTIEANLTLLNPSASTLAIRECLEKVDLLDHISALSEGLSTDLKGEYGPLSKGQALQLMLARAMLTRPRLLILDGTLDGIDETSVQLIMPHLLDAHAPWTLLVLTHEKGIVSFFSSAYELDQGKIKTLS